MTHRHPPEITVHGVRIPLKAGPFGPWIDTMSGPLEGLGEAVAVGFDGLVPDMRESIAKGESACVLEFGFGRPDADDDRSAARAVWRTLSGAELGDDVYSVRCPGTPVTLVPRAFVSELLERLMALKEAEEKPPAPWLFASPPLHYEPAPEEEVWMRMMEEEAQTLDTLAASPRTPETVAREALLRSTFSLGLHMRGITSSVREKAKLHYLRAWNLPILLSYYQAASDLMYYLRGSRERFALVDDAKHLKSIHEAFVALDWYRRPLVTPDGHTPDGWLALCERTLRGAVERGTVGAAGPGYEGRLFERTPAGWLSIHWRRDNGITPAIVSASMTESGTSSR